MDHLCECGHNAWGTHNAAGCLVILCECRLPRPGGAPDAEWRDHDGYPRDASDVEQAHIDYRRAARKAAEGMGSSVMKIGEQMGEMRTAFEQIGGAMLKVGDKVRIEQGKVTKAQLGQTFIGTVDKVDQMSQMVTVRMRGTR